MIDHNKLAAILGSDSHEQVSVSHGTNITSAIKRYDPCTDGDVGCGGGHVLLSDVLDVVASEPEFPDPCPRLRGYISDAVDAGSKDAVLEIVREAVRQTKRSIFSRLVTGEQNGK
jgi:hypothetical protein